MELTAMVFREYGEDKVYVGTELYRRYAKAVSARNGAAHLVRQSTSGIGSPLRTHEDCGFPTVLRES